MVQVLPSADHQPRIQAVRQRNLARAQEHHAVHGVWDIRGEEMSTALMSSSIPP